VYAQPQLDLQTHTEEVSSLRQDQGDMTTRSRSSIVLQIRVGNANVSCAGQPAAGI